MARNQVCHVKVILSRINFDIDEKIIVMAVVGHGTN